MNRKSNLAPKVGCQQGIKYKQLSINGISCLFVSKNLMLSIHSNLIIMLWFVHYMYLGSVIRVFQTVLLQDAPHCNISTEQLITNTEPRPDVQLTGAPCGVYYEYFGEKLPCHDETSLCLKWLYVSQYNEIKKPNDNKYKSAVQSKLPKSPQQQSQPLHDNCVTLAPQLNNFCPTWRCYSRWTARRCCWMGIGVSPIKSIHLIKYTSVHTSTEIHHTITCLFYWAPGMYSRFEGSIVCMILYDIVYIYVYIYIYSLHIFNRIRR